MVTRIGVDIGGTFTDLVYYDESTAQTGVGKVLTVPHAPEEGVSTAVTQHVPRKIIESAAFFLHGTTVGLNALLERRGAKVGLLTTAGFRDVLELRRGDRAEPYNIFWRQNEPLVPRRLRLEVDERVTSDGAILRPLKEDGIAEALRLFQTEGVDNIAICLINAYANPAHELRTAELIRAAGFNGGISLSHRISGEYREYERTSTTVIDAFVRGRMSSYLRRLEKRLRDIGFKGECLITRSGSGSMSFAEAEDRPFETIMSGPVGGAQGASELARDLGVPALIGADVGGTSFDTVLILDGKPKVLFEGSVDNMPVQTEWVDVRSIGSGGGSIAFVDAGGLMRVGPRSAGAVPGPAAYSKGGTEPTMTDAAAHLGMLGPGKLASEIVLDFDKAKKSIAPVATAIDQTLEATAIGIMRIAAASMANAMREITVEQGLDPRGMTLLPFGGAGPLMATMLADELKMSRIVVPPLAGNFSAWGLLGADMIQSAAQTRLMSLDEAGLKTANELLAALFANIRARSSRRHDHMVEEGKLNLRFHGQEHHLSVDIPIAHQRIATDVESITTKFLAEYEQAFGGVLEEPVEIVSVRATLRVPLPKRRSTRLSEAPGTDERGVVEAYSHAKGQRMPFRVVSRDRVTNGFRGPAIITESTTTLYLDADWTAQAGSAGELILEKKAAIQ